MVAKLFVSPLKTDSDRDKIRIGKKIRPSVELKFRNDCFCARCFGQRFSPFTALCFYKEPCCQKVSDLLTN